LIGDSAGNSAGNLAGKLAELQVAVRRKSSSQVRSRRGSKTEISGVDNDSYKDLLDLLEICLNLQFLIIQNNSIKKILLSTPEFSAQTKILLKTLLQLLLLPQLLKVCYYFIAII
jgi:hypothetical protein